MPAKSVKLKKKDPRGKRVEASIRRRRSSGGSVSRKDDFVGPPEPTGLRLPQENVESVEAAQKNKKLIPSKPELPTTQQRVQKAAAVSVAKPSQRIGGQAGRVRTLPEAAKEAGKRALDRDFRGAVKALESAEPRRGDRPTNIPQFGTVTSDQPTGVRRTTIREEEVRLAREAELGNISRSINTNVGIPRGRTRTAVAVGEAAAVAGVSVFNPAAGAGLATGIGTERAAIGRREQAAAEAGLRSNFITEEEAKPILREARTKQIVGAADAGFGVVGGTLASRQASRALGQAGIENELEKLGAKPLEIISFQKSGKGGEKIAGVAQRKSGQLVQEVEFAGGIREGKKGIQEQLTVTQSRISGTFDQRILDGLNKDIKFGAVDISVSGGRSKIVPLKDDLFLQTSQTKTAPITRSSQIIQDGQTFSSKDFLASAERGGVITDDIQSAIIKQSDRGFTPFVSASKKGQRAKGIVIDADKISLPKQPSSSIRPSVTKPASAPKPPKVSGTGTITKNIQTPKPAITIKAPKPTTALENVVRNVKPATIPKAAVISQASIKATDFLQPQKTRSKTISLFAPTTKSGTLNLFDSGVLQGTSQIQKTTQTNKGGSSTTPSGAGTSITPIGGGGFGGGLFDLPAIGFLESGGKIPTKKGARGKKANPFDPNYTASLVSAAGLGPTVKVTKKQAKKLKKKKFTGLELRPLIQIT